jgi:PKD repeat protein
MKIIALLTFIIVFFIEISLAQPYTLQHTNVAGTTVDWTIERITSDYGRRNHDGTRWHKGIDYTPFNGAGLRIVTLSSGRVTKLFRGGSGYTVLVIEGGEWYGTDFQPNNSNFGFGHIFQDGNVGNGLVSGNFVLLYMKSPNANHLAILDLNSDPYIAIGPVTGKVSYLGQEYDVNQRIDMNQYIAPIGGSGGYPPHIHLYLFQNPNDPGDIVQFTSAANCRNPLQLLQYPQLGYQIRIEGENAIDNGLHNLTLIGSNTFYPGDISASIIVKDLLNSAGNTSTYGNTVKDTDSLHLYIKQNYEPADAYRLVQGHILESKICYGGRHNGYNIYPTNGNPQGNTGNNHADITDNTLDFDGSTTRTGILPYAYSNSGTNPPRPRPFDLHYFSDIYTRIQNDHVPGTPLIFAPISKFARYPDGEYHLLARMTTVRNVTYPNNNIPQRQIIIDNFRPYIEKVEISQMWQVGGFQAPTTIYNSEWLWTPGPSGGLSQEILENKAAKTNCPTTFQITSSEPLEHCKLTINPLGYTQDKTTPENEERTLWEFEISDFGSTQLGVHTLMIEGLDLAGNQLQTNPHTISIRQQDENDVGTWVPAACPGPDQNHSFEISSCMLAFSVSSDFIPAGEETTILITNLSSGYDETNYEWLWTFGNAITLPSEYVGKNPPPITYLSDNEPGDNYKIQIKLIDGNNLMDQLQHNIVVYDPDTYLDVDFDAESDRDNGELYGNSPFTIDFTDITSGNPDSWQWDFGDGWGTRSVQNPTYTFYNQSNSPQHYTVTLEACNTVTNCAVEMKESLITVYPQNASLDPVANFSFSQTSLFTPCTVYFTNTSSGEIDTYEWDFNDDGIIECTDQNPAPIEFWSGTNTTFSLKVKNSATQASDVFTKQFYVYENPNSGYTVDFSWNPEPAVQGSLVHFNEDVTGFYYSFNCKWIIIGPFGYYQESYLNNPNITFNEAGIYTVILEVYDFYDSFLGVCSKQVNVTPPSLVGAPGEIIPDGINYFADFGNSVQIDGNFAVIGSVGNESKARHLRGAIYIYEFHPENQQWTKLHGPLVPGDVSDDDMFGSSVAISGNYIVAGAPYQSNSVERNGAVYVYEYDGSAWNLNPEKLIPSDATFNDGCGRSVAIDGDYLVIGTNGGVEFPDSATTIGNYRDHQGKAYIFKHVNSTWIEKCKIFDESGFVNDGFGECVSISNTRIAVGSEHDKAFIFDRINDVTWEQQTISLGTESDEILVSVSQNAILIGDHTEYIYGQGVGCGKAYIYEFINNTWVSKCELPHNAMENSHFGYSVSINGNYAVVGAPAENVFATRSGSTFIYRKGENDEWQLLEKVTPVFDPNVEYQNTDFGFSVFCDGSSIIVGRPGCEFRPCDPSPPENFPGAATIFTNYVYPCDRIISETDFHPSEGTYPENSAGYITLGGSPPGEVYFQSGVDIAYVGDEVSLLDGFTASHGCDFVAKGMVCTYQPNKSESLYIPDSDSQMEDGFNNEDLLSSIETNNEHKEIFIYPNPATGIINIALNRIDPDKVDFLIMDIFGKILSIEVEVKVNLVSIDLSSYPKGIYLLIVKTSDKVINEKIVLQ